MNRADLLKNVLLYAELAKAATAKGNTFRAQLDEQAKTEYAEQGTAPTWRLKDIGTVTLPVTQETVYLADRKALLEWVLGEEPSAIETVSTVQVATAYLTELEKRLVVVGEMVVDPASGQQVPGYAVRPGGLPKSLTFRPTADAQALVREHANGLLAAFEATLTGGESA